MSQQPLFSKYAGVLHIDNVEASTFYHSSCGLVEFSQLSQHFYWQAFLIVLCVPFSWNRTIIFGMAFERDDQLSGWYKFLRKLHWTQIPCAQAATGRWHNHPAPGAIQKTGFSSSFPFLLSRGAEKRVPVPYVTQIISSPTLRM